MGSPRFPLKGSFKGDVDIGIDIDVDIVDIELDDGDLASLLSKDHIGLIMACYGGLKGILSGLTKAADHPSWIPPDKIDYGFSMALTPDILYFNSDPRVCRTSPLIFHLRCSTADGVCCLGPVRAFLVGSIPPPDFEQLPEQGGPL